MKHTHPKMEFILYKLSVINIAGTYRHAFRTSAELGYMDTDIDGMI